MHYHTADLVNSNRYTHRNKRELDIYLKGTGTGKMHTRGCTRPECARWREGDSDEPVAPENPHTFENV